MVRAASRCADQPHGGGHGKARKVEPANSRGDLPAAAASQDRGGAAQGGRDRFSSLRPRGVSAGAADHHHLRAAAAAHSAKNRGRRSEEHTSELQSRLHLVCRLLLEKKKKNKQVRNKNYNYRQLDNDVG